MLHSLWAVHQAPSEPVSLLVSSQTLPPSGRGLHSWGSCIPAGGPFISPTNRASSSGRPCFPQLHLFLSKLELKFPFIFK